MTPFADGRRRAADGSWEKWCPYCDITKAERFSGRMHLCNPPPLICGPGCQLTKSFEWLGIRDDGTCGCKQYAAQMDAWGPDGCEEREEEILDHLGEIATKRSIPFIREAARRLLRRAIAAARREAAAS